MESVVDTAERLEPDLVVVSATTKRRLTPLADSLTALGRKTKVAVAGAGTTGGIDRLHVLAADPVTAAMSV